MVPGNLPRNRVQVRYHRDFLRGRWGYTALWMHLTGLQGSYPERSSVLQGQQGKALHRSRRSLRDECFQRLQIRGGWALQVTVKTPRSEIIVLIVFYKGLVQSGDPLRPDEDQGQTDNHDPNDRLAQVSPSLGILWWEKVAGWQTQRWRAIHWGTALPLPMWNPIQSSHCLPGNEP